MIDPQRVRAANERRQASVVADLADEHERLGGGTMAYTAGTRWICKAVGVDLDGPLTTERVETIVAWFRARGVDPVVEITSLSGEASFEALADAGFTLVEVENVLALESASLEEEHLSIQPPEGVHIRRVDTTDDAEVRRYAEIVCSGFAPPDAPIPEGMIESSIRSQHMPTYVGWVACVEDGTLIAGAGSEVVDAGGGNRGTRLLAFCGTTVLPAHRRRGLQRALMSRRLAMGVERGCDLALVESKPGIPTERNAARLGFALAYVRLVLRTSI